MILNLKQVNFKRQIDEVDNESVSISISGQNQITAGDFQKFISGFQVLNKDLVICNLDPKVNINMEITIEKGRGYVPAEENKKLLHQLEQSLQIQFTRQLRMLSIALRTSVLSKRLTTKS